MWRWNFCAKSFGAKGNIQRQSACQHPFVSRTRCKCSRGDQLGSRPFGRIISSPGGDLPLEGKRDALPVARCWDGSAGGRQSARAADASMQIGSASSWQLVRGRQGSASGAPAATRERRQHVGGQDGGGNIAGQPQWPLFARCNSAASAPTAPLMRRLSVGAYVTQSARRLAGGRLCDELIGKLAEFCLLSSGG